MIETLTRTFLVTFGTVNLQPGTVNLQPLVNFEQLTLTYIVFFCFFGLIKQKTGERDSRFAARNKRTHGGTEATEG